MKSIQQVIGDLRKEPRGITLIADPAPVLEPRRDLFGPGGREAFIANPEYVPACFAKAIDHTAWTEQQKAVMDKIAVQRRSGIVAGANGTGKTLMMYQLMVGFFADGVDARHITALELFEYIRSLINGHKEVVSEVYKRFARPYVLFIDEMDKAFGSQAEYLYLNALVDKRYSSCYQTVVLGNFQSWQACSERIGQSTFDRLTDSRCGFYAQLNGGSFRQEMADDR